MSRKRFIITKSHLVSKWGFDVQNDICSICRNSNNEPSLQYQERPCIDTYITEGVCGHAFHHDCISNWIKTNPICPICATSWVFKKKKKLLTKISSKTMYQSAHHIPQIQTPIVIPGPPILPPMMPIVPPNLQMST